MKIREKYENVRKKGKSAEAAYKECNIAFLKKGTQAKVLAGLCEAFKQLVMPCSDFCTMHPDDHGSKGIVVIPADFKIIQVIVIPPGY